MRRTTGWAAVAAAMTLAACQPAAPEQPAVDRAWVRLPAVTGRPGAAYFTLRGGREADRLVGVESAKATRAELHDGGMEGGMMTMRPMDGLDLPAGGEVAFAPGGDHVMLFGLDPALKPGGTIPIRLRFRSGTTRDVEAKLVATGGSAPAFED